MQTKESKESPAHSSRLFFQKRSAPARQHDLLQLQRAYRYLNNANPSGDRSRKQMRGVQLAQQLVDPNIHSVQAVLVALAGIMARLQVGYPMIAPLVNENEDNCRRYPCGYDTTNYDAAWLHYVNCLLGIPDEDSIIETDVYNYSKPKNTDGEGETDGAGGGSNESLLPVPISGGEVVPVERALPVPASNVSNVRSRLLRRFLNTFRSNNP